MGERLRASPPGTPGVGIPADGSRRDPRCGVDRTPAPDYAPAGLCELAAGLLAARAHRLSLRVCSRNPRPQATSHEPIRDLQCHRTGARR